MDQQKIDMYIMTNQKYFPAEKIMYIKEKLENADEKKLSMLYYIDLKDPTANLLISLFLGSLGVDRFMLGDIGIGILKLLTGGCCGILTLIDWLFIQKKTKKLNFDELMTFLLS